MLVLVSDHFEVVALWVSFVARVHDKGTVRFEVFSRVMKSSPTPMVRFLIACASLIVLSGARSAVRRESGDERVLDGARQL